ncbi:hypothetical protein NHX12_020088 [Muraenolepis orangiensis]|uniref:Uncharacterized protein n=1 Tax=Muraenolepis orangiensis TaxID=630683 RepID=A0A9Q0IXT0_9TELE|nr:hypothetical protein NHX12_020088 [Muraenolepis orangiensis]
MSVQANGRQVAVIPLSVVIREARIRQQKKWAGKEVQNNNNTEESRVEFTAVTSPHPAPKPNPHRAPHRSRTRTEPRAEPSPADGTP